VPGDETAKPGRLILTTVGTSSVNQDKLGRLYLSSAWLDLKRSLPRASENWHRTWTEEDPPTGIVRFRDSYWELIGELDVDEEKDKPRLGGTNVFSAEMTTLHLLRPTAEDRIALLLSDSPEGVICGLLVQKCLTQRSIHPDLEIITGLQVENFKQFFEDGLNEFFGVITRSIQKFPDKRPVLNVTGGFKSLIPYATYAALAHRMALYFSFEEQPELISIDPSRWPESFQTKAQEFQEELRREPILMRTPAVEEY